MVMGQVMGQAMVMVMVMVMGQVMVMGRVSIPAELTPSHQSTRPGQQGTARPAEEEHLST